MEQITNVKDALEFLDNYILIAKNYNIKSCFFIKSNDKILVINENSKYYISRKDFINDFNLFTFYIYKSFDEIDIDQEFHTLRQ